MKSITLLSTLAIGAQAGGANYKLEIFWLTSANRPPAWVNGQGIQEYKQIPMWRNRFLAPLWEEWFPLLDVTYNWWFYGETTKNPCHKEIITTRNFKTLLQAWADWGTDAPTELTNYQFEHAGYDMITYATTLFDPQYDIHFIMWENAEDEEVDVAPFPKAIEYDQLCHADGTAGHVSKTQFLDAFPTNNERVFTLNYKDRNTLNQIEYKWKKNFDYGIMNYKNVLASYSDFNMQYVQAAKAQAQQINLQMMIFFARGVQRFELSDLGLDENKIEDLETFKEVYWPMFLEVYGKNATKPWKSRFYLPDDHPVNTPM